MERVLVDQCAVVRFAALAILLIHSRDVVVAQRIDGGPVHAGSHIEMPPLRVEHLIKQGDGMVPGVDVKVEEVVGQRLECNVVAENGVPLLQFVDLRRLLPGQRAACRAWVGCAAGWAHTDGRPAA